jgi:rod shape determining protein RodA
VRRFDLSLPLAALALAGAGLLTILSAGGTHYFFRQLLFLPAALGVGIAAYFTPRKFLYAAVEVVYALAILALLAVLALGTGPGSRRWFALGPFMIQPSEFAKIATVLMLAKQLSLRRTIGFNFRDLAGPVLLTVLPALLVMVEPDLSTGLIFAAVLAAMLYWQGTRPLYILALFAPPLSFAAGFSIYTWIPFFVLLAVVFFLRTTLPRALAALGVNSVFGLLSPVVLSLLKDYQRARLIAFAAPWLDPHGLSWNAIQSQIAIGSGQLIGKGLFHGTQKRLGFLPNRHTDFAFSSIGEELGLLGCLVLLGIFAFLLYRLIDTARTTRDGFASQLCVGVAAIIGYQVFVNVGMLVGLLPITGIPLPFISYGGSSLVVNFAIVGLALNVSTRSG